MAGRQGAGAIESQAEKKTEMVAEPDSTLLTKPNPEATNTSAAPPATVSEYEKKKANFMVRTFWTLVMIAGFFAALLAGHIYVVLIITTIQIISFKEVIAIANIGSRARDLRFTKSLNWYWLATTMYFLYGESVVYYFRHIILVDKVLQPLSTHHRFISFCIYIFGRFSKLSRNNKADMTLRFCHLRHLLEAREFEVSVLAVRLDAHGAVPHQHPGPLHPQQHL